MHVWDQLQTVQTRTDLADFMKALRHDLEANREEWQNWSLESYLECIEAWLRASEENPEFAQMDARKSAWFCVAAAMYMGKIYE